jgi:hypothetical protein
VSRTVDLFISSTLTIDELATTIATRTGLLLPSESSESSESGETGAAGEIRFREGDLSAGLSEHAYVDDGDLVLRRYRYVLSARTTVSGHLGLSPETAWLRRVAAALEDHRVLLVLDLQYRDEARGESR